MNQQPMGAPRPAISKWLWIVLIIVILGAGGYFGWYYFVGPGKKAATSTTTSTTTPEPTTTGTLNSTATTDETADWKTFKSAKFDFGYTLSYPSNFTVTENDDGGLVIKSEDGVDLFELYPSDISQDQLAAKYKDSTQGYMTNAKQSSVTIAGVTGVKLEGQFGKNAGIETDHSGVNGTSIIFTKNNRIYVFNAYDNGDRAAIFNQMIAKLTFS